MSQLSDEGVAELLAEMEKPPRDTPERRAMFERARAARVLVEGLPADLTQFDRNMAVAEQILAAVDATGGISHDDLMARVDATPPNVRRAVWRMIGDGVLDLDRQWRVVRA